jgi:predicted metalloprotease
MQWRGGRRSSNIDDRRGMVTRGGVVGGGAILVALVMALLGAPSGMIQAVLNGGADTGVTETTERRETTPESDQLADFVSVVLADTEDTWDALFTARGEHYERPKLVLFTEAVQSACGAASSASGPFYCPRDRQVYLDVTFFNELAKRFGAPGEFAQAYVVAHEIGHHVQNLLGIEGKVDQQRAHSSETESNALSVSLELQADCFAGVWANHADRSRHILENGDVEAGLRAASAIGDDTLQQQAGQRVHPDAFTHGSSAQRVHWFRAGMTGGKLEDCNTFQ